jgi:hypothetical protein
MLVPQPWLVRVSQAAFFQSGASATTKRVPRIKESGFRVVDENRCAGFEALLGSPGFIRMIRDL